MATTFGATELPVPVPTGRRPVSDPALQYIGDFCQAVLTAELGAAWSSVSKQPIVRKVRTHDPEKADVNTNDCPCLYVWRSRTTPQVRSDGVVEKLARISMLWLNEPEQQARMVEQAPIRNGIEATLQYWLYLGRHPNWVVTGDTDPAAAKRGSLLPKWTGSDQLAIKAIDEENISIEAYEGGNIVKFSGLLFALEFLETLNRDPSQYAKTTSGYASGTPALSADLQHPGGDVRIRAVENPPEA